MRWRRCARWRAAPGSVVAAAALELVALHQPVHADPRDSGDAPDLAQVAAGLLEQVREVLALEGLDQLVLRFLEGQRGSLVASRALGRLQLELSQRQTPLEHT